MKLKFILAVIVTVMPGTGYASSSTGGNITWTDDPCIHNCMNCAQWESATCCTICRDSGGGGGGGGGFGMCVSAGCTDISSRTEWQDTGSSASVMGDTGASSSSNVCFDIDNVKYYVKSATACTSDYTRKQFTILGCPTNITFYKCLYNYTSPGTGGTCDESTCIPDAWTLVTSGNNAVQRRTFRECNGNTCMTTMPDQIRCPMGYYGTPKLSGFGANATVSSYCTPCPSDTSGRQTTAGPGEVADNGISIGGGTNAGTVDITECYVPSGVSGSDSSGTWVYDSNCHYSE